VLARLAGAVVLRRRLVLVLAVVFLALAGGIGGGVAKELSGGGFDDPKAPSEQASELLHDQFHAGAPNLALLLTANGDVDDAAVAAAGQRIATRLAGERDITQVISYWSAGKPATLKSRDGHRALVLARITGTDDHMVDRAAPATGCRCGSAASPRRSTRSARPSSTTSSGPRPSPSRSRRSC
jgi:RND superfamily putative drug exporter